nr:immunoglobulin light chain junction region [Macaca mulatta]MOW33887.1 immunoglobulin light chain junction region [Macaca mulatta]MOW34077.1 immunoglobulin light chain junction region [Macaca mulatta]MOW34146.1 immunoglobulin light chain junction region [Macaca mulatta]MOW34166.1 immunoglobulin light chain junction region [Macaca mulatta]
CQQGYNTPYRF